MKKEKLLVRCEYERVFRPNESEVIYLYIYFIYWLTIYIKSPLLVCSNIFRKIIASLFKM